MIYLLTNQPDKTVGISAELLFTPFG